MDPATLIGFILSLIGIFGGSIMEGTSPAALIQIPAFMIVMGGTLGVTFIAFPLERVIGIPKLLMQAFKKPPVDEQEVVELFVGQAAHDRRDIFEPAPPVRPAVSLPRRPLPHLEPEFDLAFRRGRVDEQRVRFDRDGEPG